MNLNKTTKAMIIDDIMNDVPRVDYDKQLLGRAEHLVKQKQIEVFGSDDRVKTLIYEGSINYNYIRLYNRVYSKTIPVVAYGLTNGEIESIRKDEQIVEIIDKLIAQDNHLANLRKKLETMFAGIKTKKQAMRVAPEFEKYYPNEVTQTSNLPVVTEVISDLVEAGWPKDKE